MNRTALFSLDAKYTTEEGLIFLTGLQALVRLALDQRRADRRSGLNTATLVSGYPGSPLGGLDLEMMRQQKLLEEHHILHIPALNEDLAATAIFGSQMVRAFPGAKYDGVLGMWYGKTPGLERSGDAITHANYAGVGENGGVLALVGDDPAGKSSTWGTDSTAALYDAVIPIVYPGDAQEILDLGRLGFILSRTSGLWVGMKVLTNVADGVYTAEVSPDRVTARIPSLEFEGHTYEHQVNTNFALDRDIERTMVGERLEIARRFARENRMNRITVPTRDAWLGIVAAGKTYYDVREALDTLGLDEPALERYGVRILKMGLIFPVEPEIVKEFAEGVEEIFVIEEKRPFLELFIKDILFSVGGHPTVVGKLDERGQRLLPAHGELDVVTISLAIAERLRRKLTIDSVEQRVGRLMSLKERPAAATMSRMGYFCSGCPHSTSTVTPEGSLSAAGVGCHGMSMYMDRSSLGLMQMGSEGAQWVGMAPFTSREHLFQNIGDGTFFHSGYLALRFAVATGVNITYKILYNLAVAMTGGQDVVGQTPIPELTRSLEADGVAKIIVTTDDLRKYKGQNLARIAEVWHRDRILEAQTRLSKIPGVTVLIHDQQCAAEKRRLRKRGRLPDPPTRVFINEKVCEGCGDCGEKSNCLSVRPVDTEFGRKTAIHQTSCNKDYSCLKGDCPSFLTIIPQGEPRKERRLPPVPIDLPEPSLKVPTDGFSLHMMGIGGSGVVTVNQILGTAALLDGKRVRGLDQTGLAQKGGSVVSDLKLFASDSSVSNKVTAGATDLYVVFDLLVGTQQVNLQTADADRTIAVVSTSKVPTGEMVSHTDINFPDIKGLITAIDRVTRRQENVYLDAEAVCEALFGDTTASNILLIGTAYQLGGLPISAHNIREAIRLNGVAVEINLLAFEWGRVAVEDPETIRKVLRESHDAVEEARLLTEEAQALVDSVGASGELRRLLQVRVPELISYQNLAYARSYVDFVRKVVDAEQRRTPGYTSVSEAVAHYLFKLMAYKDEYEVARLHLELLASKEITAHFGEDVKVFWHLHPPFLRSLGMKNKIRIGKWIVPFYRLLRAMRRLRGGRFDFFGYPRVRRLERALVSEYKDLVEKALTSMTPKNHEIVETIAALPGEIRGYEHIKLANVERYRAKAEQLMSRLMNQDVPAEATQSQAG